MDALRPQRAESRAIGVKSDGRRCQQAGMDARPCTAFAFLVLWCGAMVSCEKASPTPPPAPLVSKAPATFVDTSFSYDPIEHAGGDPRVTTIRLGDRLRVYAVVPAWTPATLSMLDREGRVLHSVRLDLPPGGTISGRLPQIDGWEKIRLIRGVDGFDSERFERRVGVPEAELTTQRMNEIDATPDRGHEGSGEGVELKQAERSAATVSSETSLDPNFGRVYVLGGSYSMAGVGDEWKRDGPVSDEHWLTDGVRQSIAEALLIVFP